MTQRTGSYKKIGLTGGIGSGKSTAARRFAALGARVYHADEVARRALDPGAACYSRVINAFGSEILLPDGSIDRKKLGQLVFASEEKRKTLNDIIHPYVIDELFSRAAHDFNESDNGIAVFEVPLLFESGMHDAMDRNVVVSCDDETRILRVMERDGLTREQVLSRMRAQMPEEEKRLRADDILENSGTEGDLMRQVDALFARLTTEGTRT